MTTDTSHAPLTVVGVGASAGGLAALRELFDQLPADTGMSFVVVVHLAPDHQSHLADLLQPHSSMPVRQVNETVPLEADQVYVIPPGCNLSAVDTHLRLSDIEAQRSKRSPIDHFLCTLADTHDGDSMGVVLSGTGSDGTVGLRAIRAKGGITIAQDPEEAEYDGMPANAIAAGTVDLVESIAGIAARIAAVPLTIDVPEPDHDAPVLDGDGRESLRQIYAQLRSRTGHDLSGYKDATVLRRIRRRMQLHQLTEFDDYLDLLRHDRHETVLLFNDVLISVTSFMRDPEVFDAISERIAAELFADKRGGDVVRVWSVGCSTGEEAYSLAMLLVEHAETLADPPQIQIFASDLHEQSLQTAREGVYPESIASDLSAQRLSRFFSRANGAYRVRQELREVIVFAPHGLLSDPPFSHMDLVVCRNLLIYLQRATQNTAIEVFHYALEPGGFLVLGSSETLDRSDLFATVDKEHCLYRRRDVATSHPVLPSLAAVDRGSRSPTARRRDRATSSAPGYGALHAELAERFAPPSVLIDPEHRIVHLSAKAGRYLVHPGGEPTSDLFQTVPEELRLELRTAVHAARTEGLPFRGRGVEMIIDGQLRRVHPRAVPAEHDDLDGFVLVVFDEFGIDDTSDVAVGGNGAVGFDEVQAELDVTRRRLQTIVEEFETNQEEMRASNEELQSSNEELRSTMEELETSKEELQSMNEELATLNQENRHKVDELAMLSSDLQNLLTSTDIATIFLDRQLRIARFTPPVADIFNIVLGDRGRRMSDFTHRLHTDDLTADAQRVLDRLVPVEREIETSDGRWLLTRLLPYRSTDDRIEGVVITFVDITARLRTERALRSSERRLRLSLDASAMGTWAWNPAGESGAFDERAREILGVPGDGASVVSWLGERLDADGRNRLGTLLSTTDRQREEFELTRTDGTHIVVELNAKSAEETDVDVSGRRARAVIGTMADVTERVALTRSLAQRSDRLRLLSAAGENLLRGTDPDAFLDRFFADMSATLDLEIFERFDVGPDGSPRLIRARGPHDAGDASGDAVGAGRGIGRELADEAIRRHDVVVRNDVGTDVETWTSTARHEGVTAVACFPLLVGAEAFGAVAFATRRAGRFDDDLVEVIRTLVDYLAVAEQRLRTEVELRELNQQLERTVATRTTDLERRETELRQLTASLIRAEQRERERIADVLHDDLQQLLYSVQMRLGLVTDGLAQDVGDRADDLAGHVAEAEKCLEDSIALARSLTVDLAPPELDDDDLSATLRSMIEQFSVLHGLSVDIEMRPPVPVADKDTRTILYRMVRELLFNVVKHADTDHATVVVRSDDDQFDVSIADGGRGFDVDLLDEHLTTGRGLVNIRHRVELMGGELEIRSVPGEGTDVHLRVPNEGVVANEQRRDGE